MAEKVEINKLTNEELYKLNASTIYGGVKDGSLTYTDFMAWYNACNHVSYGYGYSDGRGNK